MAKNKLINAKPDNVDKIISGDVDMFFEKSGTKINIPNQEPNAWSIFPDVKNALISKKNNNAIVVLSPSNHVGKTYQLSDKIWIDIIEANLIRLEDITEDDAIRAGVIRTEKGYKHYCPSKLFPKKLLDTQEPGFPYMADARASYFTKWIDRYGILDVSFNPWIWKFKFKVNISQTFPN